MSTGTETKVYAGPYTDDTIRLALVMVAGLGEATVERDKHLNLIEGVDFPFDTSEGKYTVTVTKLLPTETVTAGP